MPTFLPRRSGVACRVAAFCVPGVLALAPVAATARQDAHPAHSAATHDAKKHETAHHEAGRHGAEHRPVHHPVAHPAAHDRHGGAVHPAPRPAHPVRHAAPTPPPVPVPVPVPPPAPPTPEKGSSTGLPLPRFAALRADTVNLRSGPGTRYPIQWVYKRKDLPVEVEREFDVWRLVEFADGTKGWVNQATLIGFRTFVVRGEEGSASADAAPAEAGTVSSTPAAAGADGLPPGTVALRGQPDDTADVVAMVKPGTVGRIRACPAGSGWCRVSIRDYTGWLPRRAFWGLLPDETISPP